MHLDFECNMTLRQMILLKLFILLPQQKRNLHVTCICQHWDFNEYTCHLWPMDVDRVRSISRPLSTSRGTRSSGTKMKWNEFVKPTLPLSLNTSPLLFSLKQENKLRNNKTVNFSNLLHCLKIDNCSKSVLGGRCTRRSLQPSWFEREISTPKENYWIKIFNLIKY